MVRVHVASATTLSTTNVFPPSTDEKMFVASSQTRFASLGSTRIWL